MTEQNKNVLSLTGTEIPIPTSEIVYGQKPTITIFYNLINAYMGANAQNSGHDCMRLNEMNCKWEICNLKTGKWREFTDADESKIRAYFQNEYGLYSKQMLRDALVIWFDNHKVNPLTEMLEGIQWDGKPRMERFLSYVMKADDTPYVRECSRLIFSGGVHRAFNPGCQFDDMVVLIGNQGNGKSTIVRWLNMEDCYFGEIRTINGKEGIEATKGVWLGEVVELMAMTNPKQVEAIKAFITAREDHYRPPYAVNEITLPRRCCFIGTTNNSQFLIDRTGNRRFYPVTCRLSPYELHDHEREVRAYIRQAWGEAVHKYRENKLLPYADRDILQDIKTAQENALEDDWRIGAIEKYLNEYKRNANDTVSVIELWHYALNMEPTIKPTRRDSNEISQIIRSFPEWERTENPVYTEHFGRQKAFRRVF